LKGNLPKGPRQLMEHTQVHSIYAKETVAWDFCSDLFLKGLGHETEFNYFDKNGYLWV
jgi:hypothetical protein